MWVGTEVDGQRWVMFCENKTKNIEEDQGNTFIYVYTNKNGRKIPYKGLVGYLV